VHSPTSTRGKRWGAIEKSARATDIAAEHPQVRFTHIDVDHLDTDRDRVTTRYLDGDAELLGGATRRRGPNEEHAASRTARPCRRRVFARSEAHEITVIQHGQDGHGKTQFDR
jgi:hypothetical protein